MKTSATQGRDYRVAQSDMVKTESAEESDCSQRDEESDSDCAKLVGYSSLPSQIHRKLLRKIFEFVVVVVGETGLGKSTLINSLFKTNIYQGRIEQTRKIGTHQAQLVEGGVTLSLTIVDTPGYGDAVDNTDSFDPIVEYIDKQFDKFFEEETRAARHHLSDSRVHACLYFISPTGHGLKEMDMECMKRLHKKVNIIPVIGKADSFTSDELKLFKQKIRNQLCEQDISIYQFSRQEEEVESSEAALPFAVVGSNIVLEREDGRKFLGRNYPWGVVNIEDNVSTKMNNSKHSDNAFILQTHCDFSTLQKLLLGKNTQDLIDKTISLHYEEYRMNKLRKIACEQTILASSKSPLAALEDEEKHHQLQMIKMEKEMEEVFSKKVDEKLMTLDILEQSEKSHIEKKRHWLNLEKAELYAKRAELEREKDEWELKCRSNESKSTKSLGRRKPLKFSMGTLSFGRR